MNRRLIAVTAAVAAGVGAAAAAIGPLRSLTFLMTAVLTCVLVAAPRARLVLLALAATLGASTVLRYRVAVAGVPINIVDGSNFVALAIAVVSLVNRPDRLKPGRICAAGLLFVVPAAFALAIGVASSNSPYEIAQDARIPLFFLGSYLTLTTFVTTRTRLVWIVRVLLLAPIVTCLFQLGRTISAAAAGTTDFQRFRDPSLPLDYIAAAMWLGVGLNLYRTREFPATLTPALVPFYGGVLLLALVRGVWVGMIAAALTLLVLQRSRRSVVIVGLSALVVAAMVLGMRLLAPSVDFGQLVLERVNVVFAGDDPSTISRLEEWRGILNTVGPDWLFGRGLGATIESLSVLGLVQTTNTHNSLLWYFLKGGVVWAGGLVLSFAYITSLGIRRYWSSHDALHQGIALGVVLSLVDFAAASLTGATFHAANYISILGFLCGLLHVLERQPDAAVTTTP